MDVAAVKEEYGKQKCRKLVQPLYDPRPLNLRLPKPEEQKTLLLALQKENEDQDTTGNVAKYGSSCLLKLMEHSSSESSPCTQMMPMMMMMMMMIVMACERVIFRS